MIDEREALKLLGSILDLATFAFPYDRDGSAIDENIVLALAEIAHIAAKTIALHEHRAVHD